MKKNEIKENDSSHNLVFFLATSERQQILTVINNSYSKEANSDSLSKVIIISMKHHQLADSVYNNFSKYSAIEQDTEHHQAKKEPSLQELLDKKMLKL